MEGDAEDDDLIRGDDLIRDLEMLDDQEDDQEITRLRQLVSEWVWNLRPSPVEREVLAEILASKSRVELTELWDEMRPPL